MFLDFPVIYASAKEGYARNDPDDDSTTLEPLFAMILSYIPAPKGDPDAAFTDACKLHRLFPLFRHGLASAKSPRERSTSTKT